MEKQAAVDLIYNAFNILDDSVMIVSRAGEVLYANSSAAATFGEDAPGGPSETMRNFVGNLPRCNAKSLLKENAGAGKAVYEYYHSPGRRWFEIKEKRCTSADNGDVIIITAHDITIRKTAEKSHCEGDCPLRAFMDSSSIGMAVAERSGRVITLNDNFARLFARDKKDLANTSLYSYLPKAADEVSMLLPGKDQQRTLHGPPDLENPEKNYTCKFYPINNTKGVPERFAVITEENPVNPVVDKNILPYFKKLRYVFEKAFTAIVVIDENCNIILPNPAFQKITGYTKSELLRMKIYDLAHPEDKNINEGMLKSLSVNEPNDYMREMRIYKKNGILAWIECTLSMIPVMPGRTGGIKTFFVVIRDITESKQWLEMLHDTKEYYKQIVSNVPSMIFIIDEDGKYVEIPSAKEEFLVDTPERLRGKIMGDELPDEITRQALSLIKDTISNSRSNSMEYRINIQGIDKWFEARIVPFKHISAGKKTVLIVSNEITARKMNELRLSESEERFRVIAMAAQDGVVMIDSMGKVTFWNAAAGDIFGFTEEEMIGQNLHMLIAPKVLTKDFTHGFTHFKESGHGRVIGTLLELSAIRKNGEEFPIEISISAIKVKDHWHAIGIIRDISERKRIEAALKKSESELKELNSTKDKFFSIIAHDLNNPFLAMLNFSQMLHNGIESMDREKIAQYSQYIYDSAKMAHSLLENLLEWSRTQMGRIAFNPTRINIRELIETNLALATAQAVKKNISLEYDCPAGLVVLADANMINTVLRNLLTNALKFTFENGTVAVTAKKRFSFVEISVSDTGVGMDEETTAKLFRIDTKVSTKGTADERGTGLGLILCKEFVEKHGGKIQVESSPGKGSLFTFTIPPA